jgi:hypothetical protein
MVAQPTSVQDSAFLDDTCTTARQTCRKRLQWSVTAGVVALSTSAAGGAIAETVMPSGSGVPVAGASSGGSSSISVDAAVNQLVDAIKVCRMLCAVGTLTQHTQQADCHAHLGMCTWRYSYCSLLLRA